ncbi:unnamed protein product [Schistosoma rodhaini]|uniref:tRNA (34-2'-O)-methyltransferase regulator WDR6 n=3 Tax=Schistosoma rodhaini TaxID=6188 RepID=A0AA85FJ83_9TREM|nr:unnamed protein product [Schistosoma rodhaini]
MTCKSLEIIWQHCPITALSHISKSLLVVGSANLLSIYDVHKKSVLCKYLLRRFVIIHNIETMPDSKRNSHVLCVFGNRFVTVLEFDLLSSDLSLIFEDYHCDNTVHCKINSNELSLYVQTLTSHGLFKVIKLSWNFDENNDNVDVTSVNLKTSACYTGHILQFSSPASSLLSPPVDKTIVFCGSTFGNIHIFKIPNDNVTQSMAPSLSLCAQKGVIFSLDLCCLASERSSSKKSFRLVSCAEDRSIAIWSTPADSNGGVKDFSSWELVYNLKAGSIFDVSVIFESRIWCVRVGDWGVVATGEDCRVVYYQWNNISHPTVFRDIHRGQNVWCCSVWSENTANSESVLLATGGNDGAICIRELKNYRNNCDESECIILPCHALTMNNTKESMMNSHEKKIMSPFSQQISINFKEKDFARVLFFGSCGRLFYITNLGLIYTYFYITDPIVRKVYPKIHRIFEDANAVLKFGEFSAKPNGSAVSFLGGYLTCCTSPDRSYVIIGNISGYLSLVKLLEDSPFMEWLDIVNINDKIMKIIWINSSYIIIGLTNGDSLIIPLFIVENTLSFGKIFTIIKGSNSSKNMRWLNAASELIPVHFNNIEMSDEQILVTGTRDGGVYSYVVNFLIEDTKVYSPVWFLKSCHQSGGCTSMLVIKGQSDCHLLSCGRTYGDVKYWSIQSNGSLNLLATILRSDHLTWIEKLYRSIDNRIYALGFQSKYFKAISLNHKCLQAANQLDWSFTCPVRQDGCFIVDCGGGNHYWDWFLPSDTIKTNKLGNCENGTYSYNAGIIVDNSETIEMESSSSYPVFASINKGKVVIQSDPHNCILSNNCNFEPIYLNSSLHGQTINTCLLLNKDDIFGVQNYPKGNSNDQQIELYCFTGGEDTLISSWRISLPMMSTDPCINEPISSFPQHHRGHISSVRCVNTPYILIHNINSNQETVSKRYVLSAGGRGQICLWRLVSSNEPALVAGFLGSKKIRHNEYYRVDNVFDDHDTIKQDNGSDHDDDLKTAKLENVIVSSDTRVMALDCVQVPRQEDQLDDNILVIAGCSDGYVRLIHVQPSSGNNTEYPKFSEIERINPTILPTNKSDNYISCCLDLKLLQINSCQISFVISNSRGELHGWIIPWCPVRGSGFADNNQCTSEPYIHHQDNDIDGIFGLRLDSAYHWMLNCQPIPPFHIQNQLAFNCITSPIIEVTLSDTNTISTIIVVGGDDGSIRIAQVPLNIRHSSKSDVTYPQWSASCVRHFSSVVKIATCPNLELTNEFLYYFLSLASDQRLILWCLNKISSCDFQLNPMKYFLLCGLGEPHSLSVTSINNQSIFTKENKNKCFVLVVGAGAQLIQVF